MPSLTLLYNFKEYFGVQFHVFKSKGLNDIKMSCGKQQFRGKTCGAGSEDQV